MLLPLLAASAVLVFVSGCVVSGPARDTPTRNAPGSPGTAEANLEMVRKSLRSYAIVDEKRHPGINVHLFGLPGADSLSQATEKTLLRTVRTAGGFGSHTAFSPAQTPPSQRWEARSFAPGPTASAKEHEPKADHGSVDVSNRIIAAGGDFLVSSLTTHAPKQKVRVVVTDLARDTTVHVQKLYTSTIDPTEVAADESGSLTINGENATSSDLTPLGAQVLESLRTPLSLPEGADVRDPDFSCALLPCVALTYDDGPGPSQVEDKLLADAETAGIRLTYFLLGTRAIAAPTTVKKIAAAGHEVGNHTFSHPKLDEAAPKQVKSEIAKTEKSLEAAGAKTPDLVRPPFGALDRSAAHSLGRPAIIWDVDTGDWKHKKPKRTIAAVNDQVRPGSIVLMHSIHPTTVKAAPGVFAAVADKGLYPVTVSQLFAGLTLEKGGAYFCRGYADKLCSNPEHPSVRKN